ncbi:hypothetical protein Aperf_G00000095630 [Anoplocephala perfoliata]
MSFWVSSRPTNIDGFQYVSFLRSRTSLGLSTQISLFHRRGNPPAPDCQIDLENGITGPGGCLCAGRNCYLAAFLEMSQLETSNILVFEITVIHGTKSHADDGTQVRGNKNLAEFTQDFLCSVTYEFDIIGRLGYQTLEDLRARIFHALCIRKTPKSGALSNHKCLKFVRKLFCKSNLSTAIKLDAETKGKLIDPDMDDAYATPIGLKFKPYLKDRIMGKIYYIAKARF